MYTHEQIWAAIEFVARSHNMSASGLAKASGLDPTSFNRSKRVSPSGKQRWPTTESLSRLLAVVDMSFEEFAVLAVEGGMRGPSIPLAKIGQAGDFGVFNLSLIHISEPTRPY